MREFSRLYEALDGTNSTNEKVHLMTSFFREQDPDTVAWSLFFLSGRKSKKNVGSAKLRRWATELTALPDWLIDECYGAVGDTAEMVALILGGTSHAAAETRAEEKSLGAWMREDILPLIDLPEAEQKERVVALWKKLSTPEIFIVNKFLTGGLRVGVSETLVYRALAAAAELPQAMIAARLIGQWEPSADFATRLFARENSTPEDSALLPKPFCLAAPIEERIGELEDPEAWQIEWKWDGIRCQIVKHGPQVDLWSRGEERITGAFPDMAMIGSQIPGDWIMDGELVARDWRKPAPFAELQKRLNRKNPGKKLMAEIPVAFIAYDFLQSGTEDLTPLPLQERRRRLERFLAAHPHPLMGASELLHCQDWEEAAKIRRGSRERGAEGLMIKRKDSPYRGGRKRGIWFKWKVDPLTVDAILTAAQPGTGKRASLYTDYTFSIWKGDHLVPIAKAYSGLTDAEIRSLDAWIRHHTLERHGPVRILEPARVFEIGFEGLAESARHKSGFALRFPRILRERTDKPVAEADRVENLAVLLRALSTGREEHPQRSLAVEASP